MDREAWWATFHGVARVRHDKQLSPTSHGHCSVVVKSCVQSIILSTLDSGPTAPAPVQFSLSTLLDTPASFPASSPSLTCFQRGLSTSTADPALCCSTLPPDTAPAPQPGVWGVL